MDIQTFGILGEFTNYIFGIGWFIVIVLIYGISTYNSIIWANNSTSESFAAIETVLQNRYDLIPNLVEVVKQYASHEAWVFTKVTEMRAKLVSGGQTASKDRFADENMLQWAMKSIFAVAENYPELKASSNFLELQTQWTEMEDRLQWARRAYNSASKNLSNKKEMFPTNIIAGMMTLPEYAMYAADEAAKITKMDAKAMFGSK